MNKLRLLIVEDNEQDLRRFRYSVRRYRDVKHRDIDPLECKTREEAEKALEEPDNAFDGAIIDLALFEKNGTNNQFFEQHEAGNKVVEKITKSFFRIPIAIFTGNRSDWDDNLDEKIMLVGIFRKGRHNYDEILDELWNIYNTGLTDIMGGRGKIETTLNQVFLKNLKPNRQTWITYAKVGENGEGNSERTQNALLRYTLNHLLQLLEEDGESCFPEEVYLYPPIPDKIATGSMVKADNQWFVVLSPACDLDTRGGRQLKTERILFVEIQNESKIVNKELSRLKRIDDEEKKEEMREDILRRLSSNSHAFYYHWLPPVNFKFSDDEHLDFKGGFLNFRRLEALSKKDFNKKFGDPLIEISPFFVKDIVSRFSSYYARQGQPDIDSETIKTFVNRHTPEVS